MAHRERVLDVPPSPLDFRLLVEESLAGIYLIQGSRFLYVNRTLAEFFGYTPDEIVERQSVEDLVAPADRERVLENLRQRLRGETEMLQYTFQGLRRDGSTFEVEVRGRRTFLRNGPAVMGTLLDVSERATERERLKFLARAAELLDSSLHYESTLESLTRLMIPAFADLCFIDIVEAKGIRRLASIDPDGSSGLDAEPVSDTTHPRERWTETVLRTGRGLLLERVPRYTAQRLLSSLPGAWGREGHVARSLMVVPLVARGSIIGAMTLVTTDSGRSFRQGDFDFAREVARGAALAVDNARLYREAKTAIKRREEVLAVVSHDLRNPLNVIIMGTAMSLEQERRRQGPLEIIHGAAKQMERLILDLLDVSAVEAGGLSVQTQRRKLAPLVERCVGMLRPAADRRGLHLANEVDDPSAEAMIDEDRFSQALSNLLGNAIKFTPEGGTIRVGLQVHECHLALSVADTGPGISPDQLERIFDRFWQGRRGEDGGAGLGLAIVRGIAEAHGGRVRVESTPGDGSTFYLELPRPA